MKRRVLLAILLAYSWPTSSQAADEPTSNALIREGAELFKHQDYEAARAAFARAYELDPKAATLFNLGLSELNSDHPVQAAAHLREYLTHADEPAAKLESVRSKWLPRAEARTARLNVFAPMGAQVAVDGVVQEHGSVPEGQMGTPMASIVTAAGQHDVTARQGTVVETQHVVARGGELVELHFQRVPDGPEPASAIGQSVPASTEIGERTEGTTSRAKWITVVALGSGAVIAAGLGVGFGIASNNKFIDVQGLHDQLDAGPPGMGGACSGASASTPLCTKLKDDVAANRLDWTVSATAFVGAGVLALASVATWRLWRTDKPKAGSVLVRPTLSARSAGLVLGGQW
jgi:hypothetical protein